MNQLKNVAIDIGSTCLVGKESGFDANTQSAVACAVGYPVPGALMSILVTGGLTAYSAAVAGVLLVFGLIVRFPARYWPDSRGADDGAHVCHTDFLSCVRSARRESKLNEL